MNDFQTNAEMTLEDSKAVVRKMRRKIKYCEILRNEEEVSLTSHAAIHVRYQTVLLIISNVDRSLGAQAFRK